MTTESANRARRLESSPVESVTFALRPAESDALQCVLCLDNGAHLELDALLQIGVHRWCLERRSSRRPSRTLEEVRDAMEAVGPLPAVVASSLPPPVGRAPRRLYVAIEPDAGPDGWIGYDARSKAEQHLRLSLIGETQLGTVVSYVQDAPLRSSRTSVRDLLESVRVTLEFASEALDVLRPREPERALLVERWRRRCADSLDVLDAATSEHEQIASWHHELDDLVRQALGALNDETTLEAVANLRARLSAAESAVHQLREQLRNCP